MLVRMLGRMLARQRDGSGGTYRPAVPGTALRFGAIADDAGNLFWRERGPDGCFLVSMSITGIERFRSASPCELDERMALIRKGLVVLLGRDGADAHDTHDGHVAWTVLPRAPPSCGRVGEAMAASEDTVFILWEQSCDDGIRFSKNHVLSGVALDTGLLRFDHSAGWFTEFFSPPATVICDRDGNAFARFANGRYGSILVSLAADGTLRWQSSSEGEGFQWPIAAWSDRVYLFWYAGLGYWGGTVVRGTDGGPLPDVGDAIEGRGLESAFIHFGAGVVVDRIGRVWSTARGNLTLRDSKGIAWSRDGCGLGVCHPSRSPMLTESGTLILSGSGAPYGDLALAEVDDTGKVRRTCTLQSGAPTEGPFLLHDGRFVAPLIDDARQVVGVAAWWLPGLTEASSGWTSPGGGPARGGAPH